MEAAYFFSTVFSNFVTYVSLRYKAHTGNIDLLVYCRNVKSCAFLKKGMS